ncbi:hypothetical protein LINPERPRIM_LOCUS2788 [Linum perenne]
MVLSQLQLE